MGRTGPGALAGRQPYYVPAGKITRRDFIRRGTIVGMSFSVLGFVATACATDETTTTLGGAVIRPGGGLYGIERRLAAFDGTLTVVSPSAGPTTVIMELPCESSSLKTTPSSGTA